MKFSDEMLMAYADGELDLVSRAEVEAAMAQNPEFAAAVERHRRLAARVKAAYEGVADEPVPEKLANLAGGANVIALRRSVPAPRRWSMPQWTALAASITLAVAVGVLVSRGPSEPYEETDAGLVARGMLEDALTARLASAAGESAVQIGMSFRERGGNYCRTFHMEHEAPLAGLACRSGEDWQIRVLAAARSRQGELRPAAAMPMAVLHAVDAAIDGEPLDAAQEAEARARGWQ